MAKKKKKVAGISPSSISNEPKALNAEDYPYRPNGPTYPEPLPSTSDVYQATYTKTINAADEATLESFPDQVIAISHLMVQGGIPPVQFKDNKARYLHMEAVPAQIDFVTPLYFFDVLKIERVGGAGPQTYYIDLQGRKYSKGFVP